MKFEDRSQEEIERQKRCACGDAWRLAKNISKLEEKDKATFFSRTDEWSLPAASTIKPEEREFVVDSGASMHMVSKERPKLCRVGCAELDAVKVSKKSDDGGNSQRRSANKRKRQQCMSKELEFIRDSDASRRYTRSFFHSEHSAKITGKNTHWTTGQKPQLIKNGQTAGTEHGEQRTIRCSWSIDKLFKLIFTFISQIITAGSTNSYSASRIIKK